jgi:hypothetical protein
MGTDSDSKFIPNPSQGDFWGGYMMDFSLYKFFALFPLTGFFGIDHLLLRSPFTALLKLIVNIFFWGAWYFYDIIQIQTDQEFVANYGLSTPWGPRGHGYKLFKGVTSNKTNEFDESSVYNGGFVSNFLFLIFAFMTLFLGFSGLPMMLGGDFNGGLIKMFSNFFFVPFVFYLVGQVFDFFKVGSIQKDGLAHPWPMYPMLTIFEKYPATNLISADQAKKELAEHTKKYAEPIKDGKLPLIPELGMKLFAKIYEAANNIPVVAAFNTVSAAKGAALAGSDMATSAVKVGQKLATAMEKRITEDPNVVIDKILGPAPTPAAPQIPAPPQKGGGLDVIPEGFDTIMLTGIGFLIVGGFAAAFLRKFTLFSRKDEYESPPKVSTRDDAPPKPGAI